ncbi:MmcQ/YjbR family DNA-binding protein [Corynebacterium mastitidis]|uniref:Cytoplasmic protein n=1 Tax=Corynebacterium mastitidis TaxID=161890 RepID=A0A2N0X682_9CORY|nr:MmcQ/YjbR family DNA-binding protein [Corynebacterium mastitidis]MCH6196439.1 MmcQ/YjbR family DNA-binding protein [Corynebacterium mastitidis]PKF68187.1 cytoplasmic protein [Corynebacterium mastitidis]
MGIDHHRLYAETTELSESLPGAEVYSFTPGWEAARVCGKWFMLTTVLKEERIVILKAAPEDAMALRQMYREITTGYHMNKRHWITVRAGGGMSAELLRELVTDSYRAVLGTIPRSRRPLGWERYLA